MRVAVLGGGLQGACVALELAQAGIEVDLYDRNDRCMTQASAQNEGKIHLGYVYAKDPSLKTARLMIEGAIRFAPLMRRWIGPDIEKVPVSRPFHYAVHRDSQISPDEVAGHLRAANALAREIGDGGAPDYFGEDYRRAPERLAALGDRYDPESVLAAFETPEIAIDSAILAEILRGRLSADPKIRCVLAANILSVAVSDSRVAVSFEKSGQRFHEGYDRAVNALWDGRLAVDATAGIRPARSWLFRVKHYVRVHSNGLKHALPSTTIVQGPFGDIVGYGNGACHLSWYPAGMRQASSDLAPPGWPRDLDRASAAEIRRSILSGLAKVVPAVGEIDCEREGSCDVEGGVIFAWGATDIDDPSSVLHGRSEVGVASYGRYHSIDTGKLTLAPLFARRLAQRMLAASEAAWPSA